MDKKGKENLKKKDPGGINGNVVLDSVNMCNGNLGMNTTLYTKYIRRKYVMKIFIL